MKKNKMMRLASALLVLTLLTTCVISGTFAKYVTSNDATDTARVAAWGVDIVFQGKMDKVYELNTTNLEDTKHVAYSGTNKIIAPGTSGTFLAVELSGTPEVASKVTYTSNFDISSNWLDENGDYYCPLVVTVTGNNDDDPEKETYDIYGMAYASAELFEAAVNAQIALCTKEYDASTDLSGVDADNIVVSWAWYYNPYHSTQTNENDTWLGDQAANSIDITVSLQLYVTVTQID